MKETPVQFLGWKDLLEKGWATQARYFGASLVAQLIKNLPAMWETWLEPLGWEDPLEKEMVPTPIFWSGEFHGLYRPWDCKELDMTEQLSLHFTINMSKY